MTNEVNDLQQAIHAHLVGDSALTAMLGAVRIHDRPPDGAALPYVTFGLTRTANAATASEAATEHFVTLHAWAKSGSRKDASDIIEAVATRLATLPLIAGQTRIVSLAEQGRDVSHEPGPGLFHGVIRLRALTEPAAV